ncbi:hypothetical protein [uncultured Erythrobacter sp.]|uniref:hypothetical protein n=1 Tax=uncultured Erythrobacter sp. TaxID=263913 RepID=UPI00261846AF|nr:hypothetical protein [uncultured Erythrobacter sp.]
MALYGGTMRDLANDRAPASQEGSDGALRAASIEAVLKDELARSDRALSGVTPVLSHLLAGEGHSLVSDAIVARLRGMLFDLARQLAFASFDSADPFRDEEVDRFADQLSGDSAVLSHCYAIAMEGHLIERLEQRSMVDPVLSPLLQELIASEKPAVGELAMSAMVAQSRFVQNQRRMQLPLAELPAELFGAVIRSWDKHCERLELLQRATASQELKHSYDEGATRVGLLSRLISAMRGGSAAALNLEHAGFALFVTSLGMQTKQPRELAVLACHERQAARLALSLRAAGLDANAIEQQFLLIEPEEGLPVGIGDIAAHDAQAMLSRSNASAAG